MTATEGHVVDIHYTLKSDEGEIIDTSDGKDPLGYLHGAGNIVPGLEKALTGKAVGDKVEVKVSPEDGYGTHNEKLVGEIPRESLAHLGGDLKEGTHLHAEDGQGGQQVLTVKKVTDESVHVDGNHPLADKNLNFAVEIMAVREATPEEKDHGHIHAAPSGESCGSGCGCH